MSHRNFIILLVVLSVLWFPNLPNVSARGGNDSIQTRISANGRFLIRNFKDRKYLVDGFHDIYCEQGRLHGESNLYCTDEGVLKGKDGLQCLDEKSSYAGRPKNITSLSCKPKGFSLKDKVRVQEREKPTISMYDKVMIKIKKTLWPSLKGHEILFVETGEDGYCITTVNGVCVKYKPIPFADVTAKSIMCAGEPDCGKVFASVKTDKYGKISLWLPENKHYEIEAKKEGFKTGSIHKFVNDGPHPFDPFYGNNLHAIVTMKSGMPASVFFKDKDYLIITRPMFLDSLSELVALKEQQGFTVGVATLDDILDPKLYSADYSGGDIQEILKNFLQKLKQESNVIKYVLLVGTPRAFDHEDENEAYNAQYTASLSYPWEIPIRYIYPEEDWSDGSAGMGIPTDQYYASATANWDKNNNKIYGEFENEEYSFKPDIYVGRIPVKTSDQLTAFIEKLKKWTPTINFSESTFHQITCATEGWSDPNYQPFYQSLYDLHCHYCSAEDCGNVASYVNEDKSNYISSYGHGYYLQTVGKYQLTKESSLKYNPVVFLHACQVGGLDYMDESLCQHLISASDGSTACIAPSRSMPDMEFMLKDYLFFHNNHVLGEAFYQYKYLEDEERQLPQRELQVLLMYNLYGDPSLRMFLEPKFSAKTSDTIDLEKTEYNIDLKISNDSTDIITGNIDYGTAYSDESFPVGTKQLTVPSYTSVPFQYSDGHIRHPLRLKFSPPFDTKYKSVVKTGSNPFVYKRHAVSCDNAPLFDEDGNILINVKIRSEHVNETVKVDVNEIRGGYYNNFDDWLFTESIIGAPVLDVSANSSHLLKIKASLPTHLWSDYMKGGDFAFYPARFDLRFYSDNEEHIFFCSTWAENNFSDFFENVIITPDDCKEKAIKGIPSKSVLIFPSGKYLIISSIIPEENKISYRTSEMKEKDELYSGTGINLPPMGTENDLVEVKKIYIKDSKPMMDIEISCGFTCFPSGPNCKISVTD